MKAAYIGRIYIENFHAFQGKNEISIIKDNGTLQQWTVIVGENNAGKTSLLKAVAGLEPQKIAKGIGMNEMPDNAIPLYLLCKANSNIYLDKTSFVGCNFLAENCEPIKLHEKYWIASTLEKPKLDETPRWGFHFDKLISANYSPLKSMKIYGYGVSRKISNHSRSNGVELHGKNSLTLLYQDEYIADLTDWLFQLNFASKNSEDKAIQNKATDRIKHIKKLIIGKIFPDISDLRFTTTEDLKNHLEFQTKDGWFQLHELGYGYQTTLAWIFDLSKKMMERYPESKQPLREPAVILIDEIDLHLHPAWQRRIINYLSDNFTATQFIVTTHSPHVLQELKEVNLVQLKRENGATKIICRPNSSFQGWTIEEILNDVLETPSTHSTHYEELIRKFDQALDNEDFKTAHETYETLSKILHPSSPDRKILEIQLSQLTA